MGVFKTIISIITVAFIASCNTSDDRERLLVYFDLEGLLDEQVAWLAKARPEVQKSVDLDGNVEQITVRPDSNQWVTEFEIFKENDINKPSLIGAFDEISSMDEILYKQKNPGNDGVQELNVVFFEETRVPRKISISSVTENSLYESGRELELIFSNVEGVPRISSYMIEGRQTILSNQATSYKLKVAISQ